MTAASNQAHGEGKRGCGAKRQPRYLEIRNALRDRITGGGYRIAEKLPSEHTLMERFAASRVTIRKALSGLLEDGLIVSRQGEGYFVTRPAVVQDLRRLQGLSERARELGHQVRSEVVSTREVDADKAVAEALSLRPGTRVFKLKRVRYLNASPLFKRESAVFRCQLFPSGAWKGAFAMRSGVDRCLRLAWAIAG